MHLGMKGLGLALVAGAASAQHINVISRHNGSCDVFATWKEQVVYKKYENGAWAPTGLDGERIANDSVMVNTAAAGTTWCDICIGTFFVCKDDGNVYERYFRHGVWNPDEEHACLGDNISGPPDGATHVSAECTPGLVGYDNMIARGANGSYYTKWSAGGDDWFPGGSPGDWVFLGGDMKGAPAVKYVGQPEFHLFGVDKRTGAVYHKFMHFKTGEWEPSTEDWDSLGGGPFQGGVTATSWSDTRFDVWAVGMDGILYHKWSESGKFSGWENLGGFNLVGPPQVVSTKPGIFDIIAAQDNGDGTYTYVSKSYTGVWWQPWVRGWWTQLGTYVSPPGIIGLSSSSFAFFGINTDGKLVARTWKGLVWSPAFGWEDLVDLNAAVSTGETPLLQHQEMR